MVSEPCGFCGGPVNPHDLDTAKQITAWVMGPKKDHATLREDTGKYAHGPCVNKARTGQAADQPDLFGEDRPSDVGAEETSSLPTVDEVLGGSDNGS